MSHVDIVKITAVIGFYHAVEQKKTGKILHTCDTQADTIKFAKDNGHTINIHRERKMKETDEHGRFRPK